MKYLLLGEAHLEVNSFQKTEEGCLVGEAVGSSEATPAAVPVFVEKNERAIVEYPLLFWQIWRVTLMRLSQE